MANIAAMGNNVDQIHLVSTLVDSSTGEIPLVPGCHLPTETLIQIFLETLAMVISDKINNRPIQCRHPTLAIASVCHRWRDIALGAPDLWGYFPVNGLKTHGYAEKVSAITKAICMRATHTKELFLDFTNASNHPSRSSMESIIIAVEAAFGTHDVLSHRITIYWPSWKNSTVTLGCIAQTYIATKQYNYRLYNILPDFSNGKPNQVHSLALHLGSKPARHSIFTLLKQCPNLVHLKVDFPDPTYGILTYDQASFLASPHLQSLSTRLSMMPVFFNGHQSISKGVTSLHITLDNFLAYDHKGLGPDHGFERAFQERPTPQTGGHTIHSNDKAIIYQVIVKFAGVITLSLHGRLVSAVLDVLPQRNALLPALRRLEMAFAAISPAKLDALLHSYRKVSIEELVFDRCSNITQEYCEKMKGKVDRVIVY